jgi:hypothetical protein
VKVVSSCVEKAPGRRPAPSTLAADLRALSVRLAAAPALAGQPPPVPAALSAPATGAAPRMPSTSPSGKAVEAVRAADRAEAGGGTRRWSPLRRFRLAPDAGRISCGDG